MGSSMNEPLVPEKNRLNHKTKLYSTNLHQATSLDTKPNSHQFIQSDGALSQPHKAKRKIQFKSIKQHGQYLNNSNDKTPMFTNSLEAHNFENVDSDIKPVKTQKLGLPSHQPRTKSLEIQNEYFLLAQKQAKKSSFINKEWDKNQEALEQQFKLSLNSNIKDNQEESEHTFSHAIESKQSAKNTTYFAKVAQPNPKVSKLLARMITQEKDTSTLLNKYLPKSKLQFRKNLDIKLVPAARSPLGIKITEQAYSQLLPETMRPRAKVENIYTNWKKRENRKKHSLKKVQIRSSLEENISGSHYQAQYKVKAKNNPQFHPHKKSLKKGKEHLYEGHKQRTAVQNSSSIYQLNQSSSSKKANIIIF